MFSDFKNKKQILALLIAVLMTVGVLIPLTQAEKNFGENGFDKGPSSLPVVPVKKATLVNYDENSYLDDYAYMASVPSAVFKNENKLYSHPLLYYKDSYQAKENKDRSLNARQGLDYFMEDWMGYCNGQMDQMTTVNVPKNKVDQWNAKEHNVIEGDNPYDIASDLALQDFSYSDEAVISVIDDYKTKSDTTEGKIQGQFTLDKEVQKKHFSVTQTNKLNPQFESFTVPEGYKYIQARVWYSCVYFQLSLQRLGLENLINISIPSGDKDLQLYCDYNDEWMQVAAVDAWNAKSGMDKDYARTYVYKPGRWRIGITDVPTKGFAGKYGTWSDIISNLVKDVEYQVDIEMYPGAEIPLEVSPPFCCHNAKFTLECDHPNEDFKFMLIGPNGEKILEDDGGVIKLGKLGECLEDENYKFVVYTPNDVSGTFNYEITYSWEQNKTRKEGDSLTSATEGAVLASQLNSPLLYTSTKKLPESTKNTLYKLGVKKIHLVDLGDHLSNDVRNEINDIADVKNNYVDYSDIYSDIDKLTDSNDIVFSTLDPWTSWQVAEMKPGKEFKGALHLGPAAYTAAHHGSPVFITDNHPSLSSAAVWHTEFWNRHAKGYASPKVSEMYLTGKRVYEFIDEQGFDEKGQKESIITVAGQFDIGASWDRMFVGKAIPGRFTFSPMDCSYWISRDLFYPALVFENPATRQNGVDLINGSKSERGPLGRLKIVRPSGEESFKYPVLNSFMPVYLHRFNSRASKYWGFTYQAASGVTPAVENTFHPIDDKVGLTWDGEAGSFWPDLSETECVPYYMRKCGYSNAFSTSFEPTMENLNSGALIWTVGTHGNSPNGGEFKFHDPDSIFHRKESNPWRGYEWYLGSTEEPDTMTTEIHGIIPMLLGNPNWDFLIRTALDFAPAKKPVMDFIAKIANLPLIRLVSPDWLKDTQDYYDGIVGSSFLSTLGTVAHNGVDIDDSLGNIHSCGLITAACLPAYKYLHLTMVRHGSNFQIIDPWATSWYSSFWEATIPRDIALGDTVGEAYAKGMGHVGILYISEPPQWWWDKSENVCYFGDPDLRVLAPNTEYSDANYWSRDDVQPMSYDKETNLAGHMPFGANSYPHE
ncbi:MAG: cell wall-binding repeat-containing protein, partial [Candidatus Thermoplasmatota archaeon]